MGDLRSKLIPDQQSDGAVFKTVLFYSVLILLLPIASFFATKSVFFEWFLGQVRGLRTSAQFCVGPNGRTYGYGGLCDYLFICFGFFKLQALYPSPPFLSLP